MKVELNWKIVLALFLLLAGTFITTSKLLANPEITISVKDATVDFEKGKKIYFFDDILLVSIGSIFLCVLETLAGDEKEIYQLIYNAKGEILQKDIMLSDFSRAKITRLLDYLEKRGLIERKSCGMTNKVVLK